MVGLVTALETCLLLKLPFWRCEYKHYRAAAMLVSNSKTKAFIERRPSGSSIWETMS